ncbi:MAG: DNA polymerase IV [Acidobacteriota bacterium]|nr:DNA polymerase IV [Acidobacteriota bacterium]
MTSAPASVHACSVLHVDMDAFFAAVEVRDDPSLAGKPVIVGGSGTRGVVASCTYEARAFGIRSAMSSVEARRRCPEALFVSGRYWRYAEVSAELHEVLRGFTPVVEPIGLDEAFLDVRGAIRLLGEPVVIARSLRAEVRRRLSLDCSVGAARNKLLAKLASEAAKPVATARGPRPGPGVVVVAPEDELSFLHPLPVRALWGVGPSTAARLTGIGVVTVGDLAAVPPDTLCRLLGNAQGRHLAGLAVADDARPVVAEREAKSIGHEETFARDLHDHESLHPILVRMADAVGERLREAGLRARTVTVKIRFADRATITRSHSLAAPTASLRVLRAVAGELLASVDVGPGIRLLGVAGSALTGGSDSRQLTFDEVGEPGSPDAPARDPGEAAEGRGQGAPRPASEASWQEVEAALAAVRARYGQSAVGAASLVGPGGLAVKRRGDTQWGPSAEGVAPGPADARTPGRGEPTGPDG